MKIEKTEISKKFGSTPFRLIFGLGFDDRSLSAMSELVSCHPLETIALIDKDFVAASSINAEKYQLLTGGTGKILEMNRADILYVADDLSKLFAQFDLKIRTVIDITALSNEVLAILLAVIRESRALDKITLYYTGASEYSFNSENQDIWLSKGVTSIRSILGYPGEQLPSKPLHLVILSGFEVERAYETINRFEPQFLSIGTGSKSESISSEHYQKNVVFSNRLETLLQDRETISTKLNRFFFSCINPDKTKADIHNHLKEWKDHNIVICALNTKLSTVGAALYCFENPRVQLCYTEPMEYNLAGYAKPGDNISLYEFTYSGVRNDSD